MDRDLAITQSEMIAKGASARTYRKKDIIGKKEVSLNMNPDELINVIRAFDFPGHIPCYTIINGKKIFLRLRDFGNS